jgi:hypothetical protein
MTAVHFEARILTLVRCNVLLSIHKTNNNVISSAVLEPCIIYPLLTKHNHNPPLPYAGATDGAPVSFY